MRIKLLNYLGLIATYLSIFVFYYTNNSTYTYVTIFVIWVIELLDYIRSQSQTSFDKYWLYYLRRRLNPFYILSLLLVFLSITIIIEPNKLYISDLYDYSRFNTILGLMFLLLFWHIKFITDFKYILLFSSVYLMYNLIWLVNLMNGSVSIRFTDIYQISLLPILLIAVDYKCFEYLEQETTIKIKEIKEKIDAIG